MVDRATQRRSRLLRRPPTTTNRHHGSPPSAAKRQHGSDGQYLFRQRQSVYLSRRSLFFGRGAGTHRTTAQTRLSAALVRRQRHGDRTALAGAEWVAGRSGWVARDPPRRPTRPPATRAVPRPRLGARVVVSQRRRRATAHHSGRASGSASSGCHTKAGAGAQHAEAFPTVRAPPNPPRRRRLLPSPRCATLPAGQRTSRGVVPGFPSRCPGGANGTLPAYAG